MSVRAKFKCHSIDEQNQANTIRLEPVIDGSPENESFFRWTPGGEITLQCLNESATRQFVAGAEYYVDFTPAGPLVAEAQQTPHASISHLLKYFDYAHLPAHLQEVSAPFAALARQIGSGPQNPESAVALRKLLESKDCAVRARLA